MTQITQELFNEIKSLAVKVKHNLKTKGLVVPSENRDGSIGIGDYKIVKKDHQYFVLDKRNDLKAGPINLAQSAIIIANNLALGRMADGKTLDNDKWFGYKSFDEENYSRSARINIKKHDIDRAEIFLTRAEIAKREKNHYKSEILREYNRLCRVR